MAILCRFLLLKRQRIADSRDKSAIFCRSLGKILSAGYLSWEKPKKKPKRYYRLGFKVYGL